MNICDLKTILFKSISFIVICLISLIFFNCSLNAKNTIGESSATINHKKVILEIASGRETRALGLMYRETLAENHGMVFLFDKPDYVSFWMKNVKIPLDMIFIFKGKIVKIYKEVPICKNEPCDIYPSDYIIDSVVELKGGFCNKYKVKVGQSIQFSPDIIDEIKRKSN